MQIEERKKKLTQTKSNQNLEDTTGAAPGEGGRERKRGVLPLGPRQLLPQFPVWSDATDRWSITIRPGSGENVVSRDIRRDFTGEWVVAAAGVDTSSHVARPARIARSLRGEG